MYNDKYIHCRQNIVRQLLSNRIISIDFIKLKENIADPLTKGSSRGQVSYSSRGMRLKPMT